MLELPLVLDFIEISIETLQQGAALCHKLNYEILLVGCQLQTWRCPEL